MTQTSKFWHWPDRNIGKRESRVLREEHNKLANEHHEMLAALKDLAALFDRAGALHPSRPMQDVIRDPAGLATRARLLIARVEG